MGWGKGERDTALDSCGLGRIPGDPSLSTLHLLGCNSMSKGWQGEVAPPQRPQATSLLQPEDLSCTEVLHDLGQALPALRDLPVTGSYRLSWGCWEVASGGIKLVAVRNLVGGGLRHREAGPGAVETASKP